MDDPTLTAVVSEEPGLHDGLWVLRWCDAALPAGLDDLLRDADRAGVAWMADFAGEWAARPFTDAGEALLIAFDADRPVGMAVISADPHVPGTDTGRLRYIYVRHEARGRGLLRVFVEACVDRGASRWRRLRLHTDNPLAARLYERFGFKPVRNEARTTHARG